jgi:hypothetical protein
MRAVWGLAVLLIAGCVDEKPPPADPPPAAPDTAAPQTAPATTSPDATPADAAVDAAVDAQVDGGSADGGGIKIVAQAMVVTEDETPAPAPKKVQKRRPRRKRVAKAPPKPKKATPPARRISPMQTIRSHYGDVHHCYARVALKDPSIKGRVTLQWTIGKTGMPQAVAITKNTLKDKSVAACLKARAKKWKFPAPSGGVQVISYPFDLRVQ